MLDATRPLKDVRSWLEDIVAAHPESTALLDKFGSLTYAEFDRRVNRAANMFADRGIRRGDRVAVMLTNCREYLFVWFGLAKLGAVLVAINTRLRGGPLQHQLENSAPELSVVGAAELESFVDVAARLRGDRLLVLGPESRASHTNLQRALDEASDKPPAGENIRPDDPLVIMYTSGTTGPPKGVVNCHNVYTRIGRDLSRSMGLHDGDRMYVFLPLFHGNPQMMGVMPILTAGGSIALSERFSASRFWEEVRTFGATVFTHIGSPLAILMKQSPSADDSRNPIRLILGGSPAEISAAFGERFDCVVLHGWGMIEAGCTTTMTPAGRLAPGTHGTPRACFEVRIFDELDREVSVGDVGEIVVRPREPHVMFSGYFRMPERTLEASRNLWFHTGDVGRLNHDGSLTFVGRSSDAIRRSGENISSNEIEDVLVSHPDIVEAAVVGIPDPITGEEIKACVVRREASNLTPEGVVDWCLSRLPGFMVPRYVAFMTGLPKTASEKIKRFELRAQHVDDAWDRLGQDADVRRKQNQAGTPTEGVSI